MNEQEAREMLEVMAERAETDVVNMKLRIAELEREFEADPWEGTGRQIAGRQIERLGNRIVVRGDEAKALRMAVEKFEGVL